MNEKILVPALGESITEATVSKWLKSEGEGVEADEPIVELETDKVNLEVPSPIAGTLTKINSKDGSVVEVGALLGSVSGNGDVSNKPKDIKKIKPSNQKDNVINLKTEEKKNELWNTEAAKDEVLAGKMLQGVRLDPEARERLVGAHGQTLGALPNLLVRNREKAHGARRTKAQLYKNDRFTPGELRPSP